jgi:hypothetical protein
MNLRKPKSKQPLKPNHAELEKLANAQGVKPFDFKEEFSEFENRLKETCAEDTIRENSK